jgi:voltage-gated potassium channel Kch
MADELVDERKSELGKQRWWLSSTLTFVVCIYGILTLTTDAALSNPGPFRVLFAVPFIFIVIILVYVYYNDVTVLSYNSA